MSGQIDDGGNAFPQSIAFDANGNPVTAGMYFANGPGMSLRDWFAGQALAGMGCQWERIEEYLMDSTADRVREFMAWAAYRQADKMIAARKESES